MDFAFWQNGYVYHTKYDAEENIPLGSHQQLGDNTLALVQALGNAMELNDMKVNKINIIKNKPRILLKIKIYFFCIALFI